MTERKSHSLARTAGAVSLATLISRILGLVREMVIARYFSVFATDAFFAAYRIPNLLRDLFAEGALSSAFVPTFTDYKQNRGQQEAWRLANLLLNALTIILSIITLLMILGARYLVYFLVSGYREIPGKMDLTVHLTQIMAPFLLFVALAAAVMGMLNVQGKFFIPALAPAMYNLLAILAGIFLAPQMPRFGFPPITAMAIGSLLGGVAQFFLQVPSLYSSGFRYQGIIDWQDPGLLRVFRLMLPATFGLAATQINILIDNQLASYLGDGPVSWLNYAFRLMQLPIGLFGVAIATVHLANASKKVASNDIEGLKENLSDAIRLAAFLNIPATFGLIFLRYPIVEVLYQRGRFTAEHTIHTGDALLFYAIGLYAYSLVKILTPTFYALGDTRTPVRLAASVIAIKIAVNLSFIRLIGFVGLAFGTSVASILNMLFLYLALRKRIGALGTRKIAISLSRISAAGLGMGFSAWFLYQQLRFLLPAPAFLINIVILGATIVGALAVLLGFSYLLKVEEANLLFSIIRRRFKNR